METAPKRFEILAKKIGSLALTTALFIIPANEVFAKSVPPTKPKGEKPAPDPGSGRREFQENTNNVTISGISYTLGNLPS